MGEQSHDHKGVVASPARASFAEKLSCVPRQGIRTLLRQAERQNIRPGANGKVLLAVKHVGEVGQ